MDWENPNLKSILKRLDEHIGATIKVSFDIAFMIYGGDVTLLGEEISDNYFTASKYKYGIPLTSRSIEIAFPDDFKHNETRKISNQLVRGIKHYDHLKNPDCKSMLEITKGDLDQYFATVTVRSMLGCGINSTIEFITESI